MPGVESVTVSNVVPLTIEQDNVSVRVGNRESIRLRRSIVGSGYFETLNIPIVLGRGFSDDDASRRVAIVNEAMVRALFPDENPLGKTLNSGPGLTYEIIGVAKDSPYNNLGKAAEPYLYLSLYQRETDAVSLLIRTSVEPKSMIAGVQREIKELGGDLPIFDFKTLDELAKGQMRAVKAGAGLLGLLSFIGILVAAIGIYGVTSYAFNQRRREIGIRISLGAQRTDVLKLIMKEGITLALVGILIGAMLVAGMMYFISSLLFGVSTIDPLVFVVVAALLSLVAIGASLVPGMTAAKSDPVEALRHE
jgi:putative ABC transport system permease protein